MGETSPGPVLPGGAYEFTVHAGPGHKLSFATMMVQSNDLFYAPDGDGIALYDTSGSPISGDVTDQVHLWDAGTEENQEPGTGMDRAPRQDGGDMGAMDMDSTVRLATDDFGNLPAVSEVIAVTITHEGDGRFAVTIEKVSDAMTLTHTGGSSAVPIAPGVYVVHEGSHPLFSDRGMASAGLEALAEDGDPSVIAGALDAAASGVFNTPDGASEPGPLLPGARYSFEVEGTRGDRLFFASMLVQSNDLFVGPDAQGIALFDADGNAISGDITSDVYLWDAGTEVNENPGSGWNQPLRQSGPDTGADEMGSVRLVDDMYSYPATDALLRVTITPLP